MDDDNYAKPFEISAFIRSAKNSGAEVLTCFNDYLPDGAEAPSKYTVPSGRYVPLGPSATAAVFRNGIGDANAMFRRDVLKELGGWAEDDAYAVQDWELLSAAVLRGHKVEVVPEALYWYRTDSGSMARNKLYSVTKFLPMRSFLKWTSPLVAPAFPVAARQARDASLLREKVSDLEETASSQAALLRLMASEVCKERDLNIPPTGNRLRSSYFESWTLSGLADQWASYDTAGYSHSQESRPGAFRFGDSGAHRSVNVTLSNVGQAGGALQHILIAQQTAQPLLLQGWSRVVRLAGGSGAPSDYSIYADITYEDGSHRWAFHVPFSPEATGWQHRWAVLEAPKPIKIVTVVAMFRWYEGTVVFDDLMLTEVSEGMCYVPL
uniref:Glycosyl transferase family 1 n=1 Tax=Tetraselmis sp. GSL018 TaxID=582737 RepID=A0A061SN83_9CHLO